ncbi:MAG: hypothetical protein KIT35_28625 [Piscinibacter sp.]|uniref:magnesium chelatase domain-containing protein n=1 Tax=Piscinibacter sp. TaxID=1903157 RepID=UPI0025875C3B|nr:magnesium chelatase domain-containing protein [Piscinibacter sp.]MCW5667820.1 hypothetical protein [Piscinibacter sp.]
MSLAVVHSRALDGLRAPAVTVEVHLANGLPSFTLVGLAETEVKESRVFAEIARAQRRQSEQDLTRPELRQTRRLGPVALVQTNS